MNNNIVSSTASNDSSNLVRAATVPATVQATNKKKMLTDMPLEIFEKIFSYTGYKEVSNMRLVS